MHNYLKALEYFDNVLGPSMRVSELDECQKMDHETVIHALTAMQTITAILPPGVDPVKVLQGLAGEPSGGMHRNVEKEVDRPEYGYLLSKGYVDEDDCARIFKAMRAQLYREVEGD